MKPFKHTNKICQRILPLALLFTCLVAGPAFSQTGSKAPIRVSVFAVTTVNLMDWVAKDKGFFDKYGLDVKLIQFRSGPAELAAALGGELDIFNTAPGLTVPAGLRGACNKYVTPGQYFFFNVIAQKGLSLPNRDAPFPKPLVDLKGKKIGIIARGSSTEAIMSGLLRLAGLNPDKDVTMVGVGGIATSVAAFKAKRIDALLTFPPIEQLLDGNYSMVAHLTKMRDSPVADNIGGTNAVTCKFLQEHRDRVINYCKAIWDAYEFMNNPKNENEVAAIYTRNSGLAPKVAAAVWEDQNKTFRYPPTLSEARWKAQITYLAPAVKKMPPFKDSIVPECLTSDPRKH